MGGLYCRFGFDDTLGRDLLEQACIYRYIAPGSEGSCCLGLVRDYRAYVRSQEQGKERPARRGTGHLTAGPRYRTIHPDRIHEEARLSPSRSRRSRKPSRVVRVPGWYYAVLVGIALAGAILIYRGTRPLQVYSWEPIKGRPDAPVTIIEWGSFT